MTITNSSTRLVALAAGVAVAAGLIGAVAIAPAQAASLSSTQVQAIVNLLQSFGADAGTIANVTAALNGQATSGGSTGGSTGGACPALARDLQQGSSGSDVMALQAFLNASADTRVSVSGAGSPGMETSTFGPATKAAVIKFQVKYAITPAAGYVGPITRAKIASVCGTTGGGSTGTPSGPLQGGEGSLDINGGLGDVESDLDEGDEDVKVLGADLTADDSDIMVERVDVDITVGSGSGSTQLDNYITEVSVWLGSTRLATMDVDEGDEDSSDVFSFRFTGLNGVIEEDEDAELYVAVTAVNNIDSGDTQQLTVNIPQNGIRAVDAAGISETYVSSSESTTLTESGITVGEQTAGDLDITEGDDNPEAAVVQIDEDNDTDDVLVLAFDLESDNQDVTIDAIPVGLTSTGLTGGIDAAVKRAVLEMDGDVIDTVNISSTALDYQEVVFDNLDIDLGDGDTAEFKVYVDLNDAEVGSFATGSTLYASTTGSDAQWDVEDSEGDDVTPDGGVSNSGEVLTFETEGIQVALVSTDADISFTADGAGEQDRATYTIVFDVTSLNEDIYLDRDVTRDDGTAGGAAGNGFMWATTSDSTTGTTSIAATISVADSSAEESSTQYKISSGQTERFTLQVVLDASDVDGYAAVMLTAINWTTNSSDSTPDEFHTSGLDDFKTGNVVLTTF